MKIWTVFPYEPLVFGRFFQLSAVSASWVFGALDDEELFVVEGSVGGGVDGSLDSQVTCHMQN